MVFFYSEFYVRQGLCQCRNNFLPDRQSALADMYKERFCCSQTEPRDNLHLFHIDLYTNFISVEGFEVGCIYRRSRFYVDKGLGSESLNIFHFEDNPRETDTSGGNRVASRRTQVDRHTLDVPLATRTCFLENLLHIDSTWINVLYKNRKN